MNYFVIEGLNPWGGDIKNYTVPDKATGMQMAPKLIGNDPNKCVTVQNDQTNWSVWLKQLVNTNPSKCDYHQRCTTVFYGQNYS